MWLITHASGLEHDTGRMHPENINRLPAIEKALAAPEFEALTRVDAERASHEEIGRVHDPEYVQRILDLIPASGQTAIDGDTIVSAGSGEAALRAAGGARQAVDAVLTGQTRRAFCALRPPGHHAEPNQAMGFCLFNNVAIGAAHARAAHGLERVAIVDFDVHHGNGTQAMFRGREGYFYGSTHQSPLFPGTGRRSENIPGNLCNVPLPDGTGSEVFREHFRDEIMAEVQAFNPQLILISAGFDAHARDPLAGMELTEGDFAWATAELVAAADDCCQGRIVSVLEGGYDLEALAASTAAHVRALLD
jgi:acetoin utilization deacetylase AcuC-like enzyme